MVDLDATLVGAHSEKEGATPNFKRGFGFHPMLAFVDPGPGGTGEPLVGMLRPGRANANDAADQIAVLDAALAPAARAGPVTGAGARRHRLGCAAVAVARHHPGTGVFGERLRAPTPDEGQGRRGTGCAAVYAPTCSPSTTTATPRCWCARFRPSFTMRSKRRSIAAPRTPSPRVDHPPMPRRFIQCQRDTSF